MTKIQFSCKLNSDVVLNQKSASEGQNKTLDFIPGSCFLGIAAAEYEKLDKQVACDIFHSGKVRFGDAHLAVEIEQNKICRSLKVPASFFYPKLKKVSEKCYVHHRIPNLDDQELKNEQLKQCREGFFCIADDNLVQVVAGTNFAIKSGYDRDQRRSKIGQMYGYESLKKGQIFYFEVETSEDELAQQVKDLLIGEKHIGRSRSAQYGLVEIREVKYDEVQSDGFGADTVAVYAESRLIFFDQFKQPTATPTGEDLGLKGGEILWEKSQIRTFQYSPWNYHRRCYDADRYGIEKGSVIVVDTTGCEMMPSSTSGYVGYYKNEGFGKVLYNPKFLAADNDGMLLYGIIPVEKGKNVEEGKKVGELSEVNDSLLLSFLKYRKNEEDVEKYIYEIVNKWVRDYSLKFKGDRFASQWGKIRSIAMQVGTKEGIEVELYRKVIEKDGKRIPNAYLTHGVAAEKWRERGRLDALKDFIKKLNDENAQCAIINLAAEMAKKCKKD